MKMIIDKLRSQKGWAIPVCLVMMLLIILAISRIWAAINLRQKTENSAAPIVMMVAAIAEAKEEIIVLPGTMKSWHGAPIYARVNGYLKQWFVDIGDKVQEGDLLAVIDAPEVDADLRQTEADLNVAIARYKLAKVTADRWKFLVKTDSVSKQETDEKVDTAQALYAKVVAMRANRDRLRELVSFERILAPFTGIISERRTDIGALINAGSNAGDRPLFRIVQHAPLRLYVKIPENYSTRMKPNMEVNIAFAEYPGMQFPAKLLHTAKAINPRTRTLLAQFVVNNKEGRLLPGGYTEVSIKMPTSPHAVHLPVNALLFRAQGLQVATLDKQNRVVLLNVTIHRDFGDVVEIGSGLRAGEKVIINPADSIYDGQQVRLATVEPSNGKPT